MKILRCECGNLRLSTQTGCDSCMFLDGKNSPQLQVIATLREAGGILSLQEITVRLGVSKRHVQRTLRDLITDKRVVRRQIDCVSSPVFALRS